ncbi:tRNA (adenosine(37)-N6)-threonylcarbamoyltransferase complex ATPase subunit type 1 TsaE [Flagellimonas nanhaiensis]|uniref:tRNA threonylcarbamoyladenosine biosynthesis protein TsaE n=1 Tax=Flagellimonas nanhaiensis TaxID=2292706 RepID=A0A371JV09_9FLAO|nr:tRNA (adenosine(37)-N6)-threonylcarbamoyltransferase complex ATPase subunit type 1 TsaE [Allomuricauda nanhaiensis]RDY61639.1 tRNA (adenosine(37)-N6)-threonylcarbamoyltransferase complex ATPase subunit type 1 TsaE [Allomuricauda nanhaiensis]
MKTEFELSEIRDIAKVLLETVPNKTLCFYGDMGVGKTTLIKALAQELGVADNANSPTFGLVNEYQNKEGDVLAYHFDFYRIEDETEALDMGLEDYLNKRSWIFIEWPEKIASLLPESNVGIYLHFIDENKRSIEFNQN